MLSNKLSSENFTPFQCRLNKGKVIFELTLESLHDSQTFQIVKIIAKHETASAAVAAVAGGAFGGLSRKL